MMILILLILSLVVLMGVRKQRNAQAKLRYWERINALEAQRKQQILAKAIKMQQASNSDNNQDLKKAS
ncbi:MULTISPECIES: hypothetical protein [Enterococcus]|uniref:Uncharacterized protein n=1 Tax=Enterococcus malodoratus ATCC 43197 TaxID=1158601 RepID=R2R4A4_9ENTE|nr:MULTISPECIES: hypothetical protein [Enterococcus]EOH75411.1 hypothetical protein UAI_03213 [Enterococcus malodoratus ATCC 43197]EOT66874.1 hypothetical protein I585_02395 [Enterococcus malodoratus ATCC 43197]OJG65831.1 hypothetical protein RV07_GL001418 [Enterococcus malodoratus]STD69874.1 Uncharacterised protein [Enterococcus malodoratus]HCM87467.1 hypothetical protein [Enterococcus sp.]